MSVLVIIREREEIKSLLCWGQRFAHARDQSLHVAYAKGSRQDHFCKRLPIMPDENNGTEEDALLKELRSTLQVLAEQVDEDLSSKDQDPHKSSLPGLWLVQSQNPEKLLLKQLDELSISLLILGNVNHGKNQTFSDLSVGLLQRAHCDVMVMRPGSADPSAAKKIVVPMAGGPHSLVALRLAELVATHLEEPVTALSIQNPNQADPQAVGEYHLKQLCKRAGLQDSKHIKYQVVVNNNIRQALNEAASADCDLFVMGTTDHGMVSRMLFGTIDAHLMSHEQGTAVAVLRRARPLHSRMRMAIEAFAHQQIPQLNREERIELSERLYEGSRSNFDYIVLMVLATMIAALGLIQDSTAVVVGAMLVAPLMTPIVGAGLGLVQGNAMLVRLAGRSVVIGFIVAIITGFIIGMISPGVALNNELMGRGAPNALDLGIAFASGLAAAYALARPNLSAALPGVAIAAALVPPIATVGISLSIGAYSNARGAVLLFGTNVVAIIIGAAIVLHLVGIRSAGNGAGKVWASRLVLSLLLIASLLAVPLSWVFVAQITAKEVHSVQQIVVKHLTPLEGAIHQEPLISQGEDVLTIRVVVISAKPIAQGLKDAMEQEIEASIDQDVRLEILRVQAELIH